MGKEGVITVRDLLKWGKRDILSLEDLAKEGYCILGERIRHDEDKQIVKEILERVCRVKFEPLEFYHDYCEKNIIRQFGAKLEEALHQKDSKL